MASSRKKSSTFTSKKHPRPFCPISDRFEICLIRGSELRAKKKELRDENLVEYTLRVHLIDVCGLPSLKDGARASIVFRIGPAKLEMASCLNWSLIQ